MAKMQWTEDQQKVIDLRNRNILVSAAAGSGKTAVLVERIIQMISDKNAAVDIDRLLIVTFTNAAAAEMRERIGKAIEKKLMEEPDDMHLQKQMTLLHNAQITTIHSFCLNVIRNHFNVIDLDPGFRIGDEAELKLMKSDVLGTVLEEQYLEGKEDFLSFVESYSTGKTDDGIEDIVLTLYEFSMSYPWPIDWLNRQRGIFDLSDPEEMLHTRWMELLMSYLRAITKDLNKRIQSAMELCETSDGPYPYLDALSEDGVQLTALAGAEDYESFAKQISSFEWKRLSAKKDDSISVQKKELVKALRDGIKKTITDLKKNYFYQPLEDMFRDLQHVNKVMNALIDLTITFSEAYAAKKEEKNILDFNDLEHFALKILVKKKDSHYGADYDGVEHRDTDYKGAEHDETEEYDTEEYGRAEQGGENHNELDQSGESQVEWIPTAVAEDFRDYFTEILIDEYQDSNLVQETILTSISKERTGNPNLFMVGDVKQSIYKFRLARPELFMEKFESYTTKDSPKQRIDLHKNFRSRSVVLDCVNYMFRQIMTRELGNIEYDKGAELYTGATFESCEGPVSQDTELILVNTGEVLDEKEEQEEEAAEYTARELEARSVAARIKDLTGKESGIQVFSKEGYRKTQYRDIVILLRTMSGWSDVFAETLMAEGIPCYTDTQTGYFSTIEIQTVLNLLKIIDNPRQDIPFTAVLHSPIVKLSDDELAVVRAAYMQVEMSVAAELYANEGESQTIQEKLLSFFHKLWNYRKMVAYTSIYDLLQYILEDTGYYRYVSVMPGGNRRAGNLDMLLQRAVAFEATSYKGLFHFNRYIEKLHKYDIDFGEAGVNNENENAVRIMSIHKSKGLEFPVVFVSGLGKPFNSQDARSKLVLHPDLGLGPDYVDYERRIKVPTLLKKVIQKQLVLENLGEELRVLYVAMTRAKEKLILTGTMKKLEKQLSKWKENRGELPNPRLMFDVLTSAGSYLDWIVPALANHCAWKCMNTSEINCSELVDKEPNFIIRLVSVLDLASTEVKQQIEKAIKKETLFQWDASVIQNEDIRNQMEQRLNFQYPFEKEAALKVKMTVTEVKSFSQKEDEEESLFFYPQKEESDSDEAYIPKFRKQEEEKSQTDRGTLYHKVMECIDLEGIQAPEDVSDQLKELVKKGRIKQEDIGFIYPRKIVAFTKTKLAHRLLQAKKANQFFAERRFVYGIPASELYPQVESDEMILIQGMIDAYFEEGGELVLLDYKTDHVAEQGEQMLLDRYQKQLDYYQEALEQLTGKKVKEKYIYSFALDREILVV